MVKRSSALALLFLFIALPCRAEHTAQHFGYSAAGTFLGTAYLRAWGVEPYQATGVASLTCLALGLFKELAVDDSFGKKDLAADALGTALGGGIYLVWRF